MTFLRRCRTIAAVLLIASSLLLLAALAHSALVGRPDRLAATVAWVTRHRQADLCLFPDDDLRHPGWGRAEHGRIAQPRLVDPRLSSSLIEPAPVRVVRPKN